MLPFLPLGILGIGTVGAVALYDATKKSTASNVLSSPAAGHAPAIAATAKGASLLALHFTGPLDINLGPVKAPAESVEMAAKSKTPVSQKAIEEGYVNPYGSI